MTSLITLQRDVKVGWIQDMDTDSAYLSKSQYMQTYWFSNKSSINIIYNISVITITIKMSITLANFGKYAISDCLFICLSAYLCKLWYCQYSYDGDTINCFTIGRICGFSSQSLVCLSAYLCGNMNIKVFALLSFVLFSILIIKGKVM